MASDRNTIRAYLDALRLEHSEATKSRKPGTYTSKVVDLGGGRFYVMFSVVLDGAWVGSDTSPGVVMDRAVFLEGPLGTLPPFTVREGDSR